MARITFTPSTLDRTTKATQEEMRDRLDLILSNSRDANDILERIQQQLALGSDKPLEAGERIF